MRLESLYAPTEGGTVVGADGITYHIEEGKVTVPYANRTALIAAGYIPVPDSEPNAAPSAGGGASSFVDLTDAPSTYDAAALKVLVVNAAETGLQYGGSVGGENINIIAGEDVGLGGGTVIIRGGNDGDAFGSGSGGVEISGGLSGALGGAGGPVVLRGGGGSEGGVAGYAQIRGGNSDGGGAAGDVRLTVGTGTGGSADGRIQMTGAVFMLGLPASDPSLEGAIWNDAGTLKISAG